ncbi:MAG: response regulator [Gemmatimonadetes bacterium]|nr:response regulator [Gemmatimonadota bacterium]
MTDAAARLGWAQLRRYDDSAASVLIVDDDDAVRRPLERLIKQFRYEVKSAGSAEEAYYWLDSTRFEAMLLDIQLPRMSGVEMLKWALGKDPELSVIMLTGLDDPRIAIECMQQGARTYLIKPVESEFLRLALQDAIALRQILIERNDGLARP